MTRVAVTFAAFALTASVVTGYPADHGPFAAGQSPPRFPLRACPLVAAEGPAALNVRQVMIYNLIAVRNDQLIAANDLHLGFPKWVWYTATPNHKPTVSLSPADKNRIRGLQQESLFAEGTAINP